jgi:hypothetical protein
MEERLHRKGFMSIMTKRKKILFLIVLVIFFSCENQILFVNEQIFLVKCADCTAEEPLKANLEIKIDLNNSGTATVIKVYEGNLSDSILYATYNAHGTGIPVAVLLNKKYTLTATYSIRDVFYIAVDSATPRAVFDKNQCNSPCYYVYDKVVDLRLKRTK